MAQILKRSMLVIILLSLITTSLLSEDYKVCCDPNDNTDSLRAITISYLFYIIELNDTLSSIFADSLEYDISFSPYFIAEISHNDSLIEATFQSEINGKFLQAMAFARGSTIYSLSAVSKFYKKVYPPKPVKYIELICD